MTIPRLFVEASLAEGAAIVLEEAQARYLTTVLRLQPGAAALVFNGRDGEWRATVETVTKRGAILRAAAQVRAQRATPDLHLMFSPVKRHGTDLIVEKATEMGVRILQPVRMRRTITDVVRTDRLRLIAIEAAEQTERFDLPVIRDVQDLFRVLTDWDPARTLIYADEAGEAAPIAQVAAALDRAAPLALLTGPEGGFDAQEREALRRLPYVRPVSLGPRILRAETAVIAALAVLQAHWGDWRDP